MKLKILKPKKVVKYSHKYKFNIKFMIGDADGYEYALVYVDEDDTKLIPFIEFLNRCKDAYPHGRGGGGRDEYDHIEGFNDFVEGGENVEESIYFCWPYDTYGDCQTTLWSYELTYFDHDGIEHVVEIEK